MKILPYFPDINTENMLILFKHLRGRIIMGIVFGY